MNIGQIAENVRSLLLHTDPKTFIFDLLTAYGKPKASVTRLQAGEYNISKDKDYVLWKNNVYFSHTTAHQPEAILAQMKQSEVVKKHKPRFLIATNFDRFFAYDLKTDESLDIAYLELASKFDFFLPWAGMEKSKQASDSPADVKAAEKMAKLYDLILEQNPVQDDEQRHSLNVFLSRLLFCYFAEDTTIFEAKLFSKSIESHTSVDGSDLAEYLQGLFKVLDEESRDGTPSYYVKFPYVNGGLFAQHVAVPSFNKRSRELLIRCGLDLDWSEINPDIFGSMFQAVVDVEQRGNMGMHYTSYENIMKVIEPLFLSDLSDEHEKAKGSQKKLEDLLSRFTKIKVFDPACGSGNFLIIAYKELRKLEMAIMEDLSTLQKQGNFSFTGIQLSQFSGIELDDFAHEIAKLALWLAEHQMNVAFFKKFNTIIPSLPLKPSGDIVHGNSSDVNWIRHVKADVDTEVFVIGNPPYLGARLQTPDQKSDMEKVFDDATAHANLDYISLWFYKAAQLISQSKGKTESAFVSTNSICQGEQTSLLWPAIFELGIDIGFAHQNFKWENSAKNNAAVICVIIGLKKSSDIKDKKIYHGGVVQTVKNIGPYLVSGSNDVISKRSKPLSNLEPVVFGSMPNDGGNLLLTNEERTVLLKNRPSLAKFMRRTIGSHDFLHGEERWCFWLDGLDFSQEPEIVRRVNATKALRLKSNRASTLALASRPHLFGEDRHKDGPAILIPAHSSERRRYIPIGFLTHSEIINNSAFAVYGADLFLFGVLSSSIHTLWVRAIGGRIKTDFRYSAALCYNTFPIPEPTSQQKREITTAALEIISCRENYSDLSLAQMYDPDDQPEDLRACHDKLDAKVEALYQSGSFKSDEEKLVALFKWHKKMIGA